MKLVILAVVVIVLLVPVLSSAQDIKQSKLEHELNK